jgi:hypothetical protein
MRRLSINVSSPAPRDVWSTLLQSDEHALAFQTPAWLDCICRVGHHTDASRFYEIEGRQMVLPMARAAHVPRAAAPQASLPFGWGTGGFVAAGPVGSGEVAAIWRDLARCAAPSTRIQPNPLVAATWATAAPPGLMEIPRVAHVLDLAGGFERVWTSSFEPDARRAVRKAERSSLVVECDRTGRLVPVFYSLYLRSIDRWADQQHEPQFLARWRGQRRDPIRKFQHVAHALGDLCRIWVAWYNGEPAAAIIVLAQGTSVSYWRGAMDKALAAPSRANYLLHHIAIEEACRTGYRYYHMGETGSSTSSLARFKSQFGATARPYADYRLERFPISKLDQQLRGLVKRLLKFKD